MIIHTYDHQCQLRPESDKIDLQVDHTCTGDILEIRAWSYEFQEWLPIQLLSVKANWPGIFQKIQDRVDAIVTDPDFINARKCGT